MDKKTREQLLDRLWREEGKVRPGTVDAVLRHKASMSDEQNHPEALEAVRAFWQRHTQSNVDRMSLEDMHAEADAEGAPPEALDVARYKLQLFPHIQPWFEAASDGGWCRFDDVCRALAARSLPPGDKAT